jgi:hypothetical protein
LGALLPKVPGYLPIAIILIRVDNSTLKKGVKEIFILGCIPPGGERGLLSLLLQRMGEQREKRISHENHDNQI